jgi:putative transposase
MLFGRTRHAYYDHLWHQQRENQWNIWVLEMVAEIRREIPRIGTAKLHMMIQDPMKSHGIKMGRDKLHELLLDHGLTVRPRKRYVRTTNSWHWMKKYSNLIKGIEVTESEQIWVSDITFIKVDGNFNFLNLITDGYSHRIMGHCLFPTLQAEGTIIALKQALSSRQKTSTSLIHHSDRGTQYCCAEYVDTLQAANILISMTENGDPYENPVAERVNGILKGDFDLEREFPSRMIALEAIERAINAYNRIRPHMSCNNLTPDQAHMMTGILPKKWKPKVYKQKYPTMCK